jgi:hypothetical protein
MTDKKRLEDMDQAQKTIDAPPPSYINSLNEAATDRKAEFISSKIKSTVRQTMEGMSFCLIDLLRLLIPGTDMPSFTGTEKRAWILLQAAGMLNQW